MSRFPDRCLRLRPVRAADIRPCHGTCWARTKHPDRLPATYHRNHGVRYFHGCYDLGRRPAVGCRSPSTRAANTPSPRSSRSAPPARTAHRSTSSWTTCPANKTAAIRRLGRPQQGRAVLHPDQRVLGQPDRGPVRAAAHVRDGRLDHPNHTVLARDLHAYLRWRNANARHPDVLAAQRRERARVRSERQQRWGRPRPPPAPDPTRPTHSASALIWRPSCQGAGGSGAHGRRRGHRFGRRTRRWVGDERVGVRRDVSLICAGWLPQDGLFGCER